ncbi:HK97 gp10 family phage protein [Fimbriiglobus ruber]|uniref:Phage protein, HK97 gp10 family n=1 Tax=Fimbriiglobus ruber TaxID=1908690 RepID=A0A225DCV0_9BACT|nr:HK97 gp10 family phage protein [Fimbriiglobus ruber]OWK34969.1 hypothetical protein FRUB_09811 [Fimbriiglobus ruber]
MPIKLSATVIGARELANKLRELEGKLFRPAARKGVDDATKLVQTEARARAPQRTGSLGKSIGRKVAALKSGKGYVGVVGPRRDRKVRPIDPKTGQMRPAKYRRTVKYQGQAILVNPAKIAHLVEFGRAAVKVKKKRVLSDGRTVFGASVRAAEAKPFIRPAWAATKGTATDAIRGRFAAAVTQARR